MNSWVISLSTPIAATSALRVRAAIEKRPFYRWCSRPMTILHGETARNAVLALMLKPVGSGTHGGTQPRLLHEVLTLRSLLRTTRPPTVSAFYNLNGTAADTSSLSPPTASKVLLLGFFFRLGFLFGNSWGGFRNRSRCARSIAIEDSRTRLVDGGSIGGVKECVPELETACHHDIVVLPSLSLEIHYYEMLGYLLFRIDLV